MLARDESLGDETALVPASTAALERGDILGVDGADTSCRASATANSLAIAFDPARCHTSQREYNDNLFLHSKSSLST